MVTSQQCYLILLNSKDIAHILHTHDDQDGVFQVATPSSIVTSLACRLSVNSLALNVIMGVHSGLYDISKGVIDDAKCFEVI